MAVELEISHESNDEEYLKGIVEQILPKVQDALERKGAQTFDQAEGDPDILPIGGNIERQQTSGFNLISDLCRKLESMNNGPIDLKNVDYSCLERVLGFLQRRGEDWGEEIQRINEIKSNNT